MDSRERAGQRLAEQFLLKRRDGFWVVPSLTQKGTSYRTRFDADEQECSCDDFEVIEARWCKHKYAVREFLRKRGSLPLPAPRSPKTRGRRGRRNWPAYNKAQE